MGKFKLVLLPQIIFKDESDTIKYYTKYKISKISNLYYSLPFETNFIIDYIEDNKIELGLGDIKNIKIVRIQYLGKKNLKVEQLLEMQVVIHYIVNTKIQTKFNIDFNIPTFKIYDFINLLNK